jgi:hypothetical protein
MKASTRTHLTPTDTLSGEDLAVLQLLLKFQLEACRRPEIRARLRQLAEKLARLDLGPTRLRTTR